MDKYDLVIIGAGSAGLGVALASKNKENSSSCQRVLLIDKNKISQKTSASSLRIIHGGFRYLQKVDLIRVAESLNDQENLLKKYPENIEKLQCVMPLKKYGLKSKYPMFCASMLYNTISLLITRHFNGAYVGKISNYKNDIDIIKNKDEYALFWNDALLKSPEGFASVLKNELEKEKVDILENTEVIDIKNDEGKYFISLKDEYDAKTTIEAKYLVNTTGPWVNKIDSKVSNGKYPQYKWCKAFNIILNKKANFKEAIGVFGPDNRAFFIVPRDGNICVGTWYSPFVGDLENIAPTDEELDAFISSFNKTDLNLKVSKDMILEAEAGILPMKAVGKIGPVLYGLEKINIDGTYAQVLSTKYTTFVSQGKKVLKKLLSH